MGRPNILVVEDNTSTRTLIHDTLELEGYQVLSLADGQAVFDALERMTPSLVILDVMMPRVDGFTVLSRLRSDEKTRYIPVLMLTALDDAEATWKGWTGGCDYYMNKPFDTEDLIAVVGNLLAGVPA